MPVLETLYTGALIERARRQQWDQPCPTTLLVCLPPDARTVTTIGPEVRARLSGTVRTATAALDGAHFPVWATPNRIEQTLLVGLPSNPDRREPVSCAGGPVGLLDLRTTAQRVVRVAADDHEKWSRSVEGTGPAEPWWCFLDRHHADPDGYPLHRALAEFAAQPRTAAMLRHDATTAPTDQFGGNSYGPGLSALQTGAATYADYVAGVVTYGGGLLTLGGDLIVPSWTDVLVEQSLPERIAYHQQAQTYLATIDPRTVLVAVSCHR
ncbi:hypothetical protein [Rugosimonospora africana]|uniref:Uncharacterized protein n=1 Tax=Rugosimonospora africana TaxID=556532 RepID=A0A8J3VRH3_9ACTN|nr:hypothetical protein [Rugosimonospora africana]GIH16134.1 hypothetical protein Raf01_43060 [Rugosimonospora africana]